MFGKLSTLALAGAASLTALGVSAQAQMMQNQPGQAQPGMAQAQQGLTQTCAFNEGPRAGQTINYAGSRGAVSTPVGSRCADMQGSRGQAVAQGIGRQGQGRYYSSPGAPNAWSSSGALKSGFTQTCSFTSGPRAGTRTDFSRVLGAQPVAIGSACADGRNKGVAVAPGQAAAPGM